MNFYGWSILITVLIVVGYELRRRWTLHQSEVAGEIGAQTESASFADDITNKLRENIQSVAALFTPDPDLSSDFHAWANESLTDDKEIQAWLATLTPEQMSAFVSHLRKFCKDMGFDVAQLIQGDMAQYPDLVNGLTRIVSQYSRISYEAVGLNDDVEIFRAYHQYLQNPTSRENRIFGQTLFSQLVDDGLASTDLSEHLTSSGQLRQQRVAETIRTVASNHPAHFSQALKRVLENQNGQGHVSVNGSAQKADAQTNSSDDSKATAEPAISA
ncbi:MAG: hypothetical protein AAF702_31580 [Chloroflexota bacterium]